ncbi:hypothetical protein O1L60_22270 [Streptomyces diastatochromogenes]|nr:hypothetical protein [Streptomyces diastatochromogenes]
MSSTCRRVNVTTSSPASFAHRPALGATYGTTRSCPASPGRATKNPTAGSSRRTAPTARPPGAGRGPSSTTPDGSNR